MTDVLKIYKTAMKFQIDTVTDINIMSNEICINPIEKPILKPVNAIFISPGGIV